MSESPPTSSEPEGKDTFTDSEEEDEDEQMTAEDRAFIVEDDEEPTESKKRKRKRKNRENRENKEIDNEDENIDEEDLQLVQENLGIARKEGELRRLKRRSAAKEERERGGIFSSSEDDDEEPTKSRKPKAAEYSDDDDLDAFIIADEEDGQDASSRKQRKKSAKKQKQRALKASASLGIDERELEGVSEIIGDLSNYEWALKKDDTNDEVQDDVKQLRLDEFYEPGEVKAKMYTDKDDEIRMTDLPERPQTSGLILVPPVAREIGAEAKWIAEILAETMTPIPDTQETSPLVIAITKVLTCIREDHVEVPFIARHRKDQHHPILKVSHLWRIQELNIEWCTQIETKKKLSTTISKLGLDDWKHYVKEAKDALALKDLHELLQVRYASRYREMREETEPTSTKQKVPLKTDQYNFCVVNGVRAITDIIGISSSEFAENITSGYLRHNVQEPAELTHVTAAQHVSNVFPSADAVLTAAKYVASHDIATEPVVRSSFRDLIDRNAYINVSPTEKGISVIDDTHEYAGFKYLKHKPIKHFRKDYQYLQICEGQRAGLLMIEINVDTSLIAKKYEPLYLSTGYSALAEDWNVFRRAVLHKAFHEILLPHMFKEIDASIRKSAEAIVAAEYQERLEYELMKQPIRSIAQEEMWSREKQNQLSNIIAISCGDGKATTATFAVHLKGNEQNALEIKQFAAINSRNKAVCDQSVEELCSWIREQGAVQGVMLSGFSVETFRLFEKLQRMELGPKIIQDAVARRYMNSARAIEEFPNYSSLLRYTIALARVSQEPLWEYAALCNDTDDLLGLNLHSMQTRIPITQIRGCWERAFMNVVNSVGIDVNMALRNPAVAGAMRFVCGLGPRKVQSILSKLRSKSDFLANREDLIRNRVVGSIIFKNCSSFLRVDETNISTRRTVHYDKLDMTRIHPEDYALARKMAADALDFEEEEDNPSVHIGEIMDNPGKLDELLLNEYSEELEKSQGEAKLLALIQIKQELQQPYKDERIPWEMLNFPAMVELLTGEPQTSVRVDMNVMVHVSGISPKGGIWCKLPSGINGWIAEEKRARPETEYRTGEQLLARIIAQCNGILQVNLSDLPADLVLPETKIKRQTDEFFDHEHANSDDQKRLIKERSTRQKRTIKHPRFRPFDWIQAVAYLKNKPPGDLVIRPSSKGTDHLAVSWKIDDKVIQNIDITEVNKPSANAIGQLLIIGAEKYTDLDEIIAQHIQPTFRYCQDVMRHDKYRPGTYQENFEHLREVMTAAPNRVPYLFGINYEQPGAFYLMYKLDANKDAEIQPFVATHNGLKFRDQYYKSPIMVINTFKQKPLWQSKTKSTSSYGAQPIAGHGYGAVPSQPIRYGPNVTPAKNWGASTPAQVRPAQYDTSNRMHANGRDRNNNTRQQQQGGPRGPPNDASASWGGPPRQPTNNNSDTSGWGAPPRQAANNTSAPDWAAPATNDWGAPATNDWGSDSQAAPQRRHDDSRSGAGPNRSSSGGPSNNDDWNRPRQTNENLPLRDSGWGESNRAAARNQPPADADWGVSNSSQKSNAPHDSDWGAPSKGTPKSSNNAPSNLDWGTPTRDKLTNTSTNGPSDSDWGAPSRPPASGPTDSDWGASTAPSARNAPTDLDWGAPSRPAAPAASNAPTDSDWGAPSRSAAPTASSAPTDSDWGAPSRSAPSHAADDSAWGAPNRPSSTKGPTDSDWGEPSRPNSSGPINDWIANAGQGGPDTSSNNNRRPSQSDRGSFRGGRGNSDRGRGNFDRGRGGSDRGRGGDHRGGRRDSERGDNPNRGSLGQRGSWRGSQNSGPSRPTYRNQLEPQDESLPDDGAWKTSGVPFKVEPTDIPNAIVGNDASDVKPPPLTDEDWGV